MAADNQPDESEVEIDDSIMGTARINPEDYNASGSNPNRLESTKFAIAGLIYMFRHEQSIQGLTVFSVIVFALVLWLPVSSVAAALVLLSIGLLWMGEFLNSAVEAVVDMAAEGIHPMAKVAKDVAAAAVLVGTVIVVIVCILILGPPLLEQIGV